MTSLVVETMGFIGVGVMGEPMCRNLARKSGQPVLAFDQDPLPLARLATDGVQTAASVADLMQACSVVFLSLPSGEAVDALARAPDGLLAHLRAGQCIIDLGTSAVHTTRALAQACAARGVTWIDAPVARTRAAAESGTLAIMVGATPEAFTKVRALLATFATDITQCGPVGCGQVVKILNNMVLFETVAALAEAQAIGASAGVEPALLFDALSKGSADSFALRNHGMKAILPGEFPERAFSVRYAQKDLGYALQMAAQAGIAAAGANQVDALFMRAVEAGLGDRYHPVISQLHRKES